VSRSVGPKTNDLVINLVFIDNEKNREIATGYGYISEEKLGYAVNHLQQENNEFCNYTDIFDLITGRFPGVRVSHHTGGGAVYIRGVNSINLETEALYVVDGVVTDDITFLHPCDVSSIDILKDGQASIYGVRGAGGVVVLETKKAVLESP
jgi:TonB-dependent SusC/RagA subfamily outer membrane receptor